MKLSQLIHRNNRLSGNCTQKFQFTNSNSGQQIKDPQINLEGYNKTLKILLKTNVWGQTTRQNVHRKTIYMLYDRKISD